MNISDNFVVGHVGRFAYQKNHAYLIQIFRLLKYKMPSAKLLLVGDGVLKHEIESVVAECDLSDDVIFVGNSEHVAELMAAMDVFVLPSHFEGLPIVGVEAQASGLPVLFSDKISRDSKIIENVAFIPIDYESLPTWVKKIEEYSKKERKDVYDQMFLGGFSIRQTVESLFKIYKSL